jgi:hypothetical protein
MELEQLSNAELIERFEALENMENVDISPELADAIANLGDLDGLQNDADNSRGIMIDYIREAEETRQPRARRRVEGMGKGKRKSRRARRSRRRKSRRSRRARKSRRGRKGRKN